MSGREARKEVKEPTKKQDWEEAQAVLRRENEEIIRLRAPHFE